MVVNQQNMESLYEKAVRAAEQAELCLTLRREKTGLEAQAGHLEISASNEQLDVEKLEGLSIKGMLLWMTGKRSKMLAIERHEAEEAWQEYESAQAELDAVTTRLAQAEAELLALRDCGDQFGMLVREALPAFRETEKENKMLQELEQKLADLDRLCKDLEETCTTGTAARKEVAHAMDDLRTAREQTALLGGMSSVSDLESLLHTQREIIDLRDELSEFKEEMLDLNLPAELRFDLHDFLLVEPDFLIKHRTNALVTGAIPKVMARLQLADRQIEAILAYVAEELEEKTVCLQRVLLSIGEQMLKK